MRKQLLAFGLLLALGFGIGWFVRGEREYASGSHIGFEQAMHYCENTREKRCKRPR